MDTPATTNGGGGGGGGDANGGLTEEQLERQRMRPADVDADMREMARRKRVDAILGSKSFKSELERLVDEGVIDGNSVGGCLQHISDMMGLVRGGVSANQNQQCVQPIADLRGAEASQFSKTEKMLRCKLASLFRVIDMHGWAQGVHGHITVRLNQEQEHFLVNPHGLLYRELTASALIRADMQGTVLHPGSTGLGLSGRSYGRLAAVHAARPDLRCVLHVQQPAVVAVSSLRAGLLPLTEDAAALGAVAVHRPQGDDPDHQRLARDLGPTSKVMLLQNGGAICAGETVEEAFFLLGKLVAACENQVRMLPLGLDNLIQLDEEEQQRAYDTARRPPAPAADPETETAPRGAPWRLGELEFEALMRQMDNAGYRTGHVYRHMVCGELPAHQSDVEYPPAASGYVLDTDDIFKYSPMRKIVAGARAGERTRWLNSPNVYQKVEVLETGTSDPKTITKWVTDPAPAPGGTAVRVDAALQFVPKNTDPKEFKRLQRQIKENRRAGDISAGPQSSIVEGISWNEARQLQDAAQSHTGDQVVLVGAASKGIIQRGHQHNAAVYKTPLAQNPFDGVTDEDLEEYRRLVDGRSAEWESAEKQQPPQQNHQQPAQHHQHQRNHHQHEQQQQQQPLDHQPYLLQEPERAERVQLTSDGEEVEVGGRWAPPGDAGRPPADRVFTLPAGGGRVSEPGAGPVPVLPESLAPRPPSLSAPQTGPTAPCPAGGAQSPPAHHSLHGERPVTGDGSDGGQLSTPAPAGRQNSGGASTEKDRTKKTNSRTPSFMKKMKDRKKDKRDSLETAM